ncbi:DMT family transporter [Desulfonatronum thiodismutans]|uniref:DMT family transporter n=1 Tax=Desulfonatronum thiodismutans TaxID=159290 RepID=UPI0004ABEA8F|nr:DMT family transporter [Desulfonatronum thiodismutans]
MVPAEILALCAALCWSFGGLIALVPARELGALPFNRLRMSMVFVMLALAALVTGGWWSLTLEHSSVLVVSAMVGIFLGDTALFAALRRLGPRRSGILFATNAPMTALLGILILGERMSPLTLVGCILVMIGVVMAIHFRSEAAARHAFEEVRGRLAVGVLIGLGAALCQAVSTIIAKPVLASGVDPVAASALRVGTAALALSATLLLPSSMFHSPAKITPKIAGLTALSGLVGMALGMTFLLAALARGTAGVVSTLSATSPVLILPILWVATRQRPAGPAWLGAILAVIGAACIFNGQAF